MPNPDVREKLAVMASQYDYRKPPEILVKIQEWITEVVRAVLDFLKGLNIVVPRADTGAVGDIMQILALIAGVLCLILLIVLMFGRLKHLKNQSELARRGAITVDEDLDSAGWRKQAGAWADSSRWREACRALYLSILHELDEKGTIAFSHTRSNYEYWYALAANTSIQKRFRRLADIIELVWFGNHQAGREDYQQCRDLADELTRLIREDSREDSRETSGAGANEVEP
ncbi:MAG: DUF4129 domain-containing protein [Candidatus Melainabacteria bacterium]|nr:DUF4129 domain-containing protein [Candidatus Melainabacteria bacterium]